VASSAAATTTSSPARIASVVAVPAAALVGVLVFWLLGGSPTGGSPTGGSPTGGSPAGSSAAPRASGPVAVAAPALDQHAATVCRALTAKLPGSIRDQVRRPVTAGSERNAAYGDPPLVLSCGVARPEVPQVAQLLILNGVCWWPDETTGGRRWTTVDREVPVQVTIPNGDDPPSQWVIGLSPAIGDAIPSAPSTCDKGP
jgi:hypothetical protein